MQKEILRLKEEVKQLKVENQDLLSIFNHMPDTYYRADAKGVILKVSASAESLMQCKTKDLLGKKLSDFYVDANGRNKFLKELANAKGFLHHHQHQVRRMDGKIIWLSTN
ncbi:MAG: PAS domain-containing protein, partial [Mariprofundaceae bacterium]|nr:PAS domain-containing protein [Mariprofundaceae bacterium]